MNNVIYFIDIQLFNCNKYLDFIIVLEFGICSCVLVRKMFNSSGLPRRNNFQLKGRYLIILTLVIN